MQLKRKLRTWFVCCFLFLMHWKLQQLLLLYLGYVLPFLKLRTIIIITLKPHVLLGLVDRLWRRGGKTSFKKCLCREKPTPLCVQVGRGLGGWMDRGEVGYRLPCKVNGLPLVSLYVHKGLHWKEVICIALPLCPGGGVPGCVVDPVLVVYIMLERPLRMALLLPRRRREIAVMNGAFNLEPSVVVVSHSLRSWYSWEFRRGGVK